MSKTLLYLCAVFTLFLMLTIPSCAKALEVELYAGKKISLLDMQLPEEKLMTLGHQIDFGEISSDIKPFQYDLGMSNVPVLDQGQYGTCVTFASTAALDARLSLGDFISQQCSLMLDKALGKDYWDGAYYPSEIIDPLQKYGVVKQEKCNATYPSRNASISVSQYQSLADKEVSAKVSQLKYTYYGQNNLNALKSAISAKKRVLIAFLLNPNSKDGVKGYDVSVKGVKKYGGLWACSNPDVSPQPTPSPYEQCLIDWPDFKWFCDMYYRSEISSGGENCGRFNAGHEVVVVGYDDAQKLLKIRNSWGTSVGDSGEYYMSYEFFSSQVVDMTVVE